MEKVVKDEDQEKAVFIIDNAHEKTQGDGGRGSEGSWDTSYRENE